MTDQPYHQYPFQDALPSHMHHHFMRPLRALCGELKDKRILDIGCGNGFTAGQVAAHCREVVGIDLSENGIAIARKTYPSVRFECLPVDDSILVNLQCNPFDIVISTEVIEHVYDPHNFARSCYTALRPGGRLVISTPYHGYLKNLFISLLNQWDRHANPLWRGGHIKLWSRNTLSALLRETGFIGLRFCGVGRAPYLWMTMLMAADKPPEP